MHNIYYRHAYTLLNFLPTSMPLSAALIDLIRTMEQEEQCYAIEKAKLRPLELAGRYRDGSFSLQKPTIPQQLISHIRWRCHHHLHQSQKFQRRYAGLQQ